MFYHGYIFQTMLAVAGPLNDGEVHRIRTIQLIYGVNKSFKIRLNENWHSVRCCILDANVPHYINGDGDWQFCFYIYPDSHLGHLLSSTILKGSPVSIFSHEESSAKPRVIPSAVRPVSPVDLMDFFNEIIFIFTGKRPCSRPELPLIKELKKKVSQLDIVSGEALEEAMGRPVQELANDFKRISEFSLDTWLLHHRMMRFFDLLDEQETPANEETLELLMKSAGIGGIDALDRLFYDFFGIPYTRWVSSETGTVVLSDQKIGFPCFM